MCCAGGQGHAVYVQGYAVYVWACVGVCYYILRAPALATCPQVCYNILRTQKKMNTYYPQRRQLTITLDLEVYDDFDPVSIDWHELLELGAGEDVEATILEKETYEDCDT